MTEPTDDRRWFRDHVVPVLDAEPVALGWDAIADRLDGIAPAPAESGPGPGRGRRVLAVAAAIAVVAGAAIAARAVTDREEPADVTAGSAQPGWVIPDPIPGGWTLRSADLASGTDAPGVVTVTLVDEHGRQVRYLLQSPGSVLAPHEPAEDAPDPDASGITWLRPSDENPSLNYLGRTDEADIVAVVEVGIIDLDDLRRREAELTAARDEAEAMLVEFQIGIDSDEAAPEHERLIAELEEAERALAEFQADPMLPSDDADARAALDELVGALRPASTEAWRAFLDPAGAHVDDALRTAVDLAEVLEPEASTEPTPPTDPAAPTTAVLDDPQVELPPAPDGWLQSEPATLVPGDGRDSSSSLPGVEAWIEVPTDQVPAGDTLPARIAMWNRSDESLTVNECSDVFTTWGLVPADEPDTALPGRTVVDCFSTPSHSLRHGETVRWDLDWTQVEPGLVARSSGEGPEFPYLGALDPGRYLGVVTVPTRAGDLRMALPITVTEPRCEGLTDELVERYLGLSGEAAGSEAPVDGFTFRLTSIDGEAQAVTDDLICTRLNVDLVGSKVARISLG